MSPSPAPESLSVGVRVLAALVGAAVVSALACILPDDIGVLDEDSNRHTVKFVEPTVLTTEAEAACRADHPELSRCPQPPPASPENVLPHFLDPTLDGGAYDFCTCPAGQRDGSAQRSWDLYLEDRDGASDDDHDELYVALLLDYVPGRDVPMDSVAYTDYVDPSIPLNPPLTREFLEFFPIDRPDPKLRIIQFGSNVEAFDFCNRSGRGPLAPGYHSLRVVATDRPWFRNSRPIDIDTGADTSGLESETDGLEMGNTQVGVPDINAGASHDSLTYVFHCRDPNEMNATCTCISEDEPEVAQ